MINTKENVYEDLERTRKILTSLKKSIENNSSNLEYHKDVFEKISPVYPFTNELMQTYNDMFDLENKKVLSVTGAGDQSIIALTKNAKKIDTFDCNKLTYYHMFFKIAAIKSLSYEEFIKLYTVSSDMNIEEIIEIYKKVKNNIINDDIKTYWNNFFKKDPKLYRYFFMDGCCTPNLYDVGYVEKTKFEQTKQILNEKNININYDLIGVYRLYNYQEKYDFINLSNIMNYMVTKLAYAKLIKKLIDNNLEKNGVILTTYNWTPKENSDEIFTLEELKCNPKVLSITKKYKTNSETNYMVICK